MSIQNRIRSWLGITEIQEDQAMIVDRIKDLNANIVRVGRQVSTITPGLGRIIAKLDPMYGADPHSKERKAESDRLGEEAINRLTAEQAVREHYRLEPKE